MLLIQMQIQRFVCLFLVLTTWSGGARCNAEVEMLHKIVNALESGLRYMEEHFYELNLDGVFGCRLIQEHLQMFLAADPGVFNILGDQLRERLTFLQHIASNTVKKSMSYLKHSESEYFKKLGRLLYPSEVLMWYRSKMTNPQLVEDPLICPLAVWDETTTDMCFMEILGTRPDAISTCVISDDCVKYLMTPKLRDYGLTHQVLLLQLLEKGDCVKNVRALNSENVFSLQEYLCANVKRDAEKIEKSNYPISHQDLFMEQVGLCGLYGYSDFYKPEWLEAIMSWQHPSGCYATGSFWYCSENLTEDTKLRGKREETHLKGNLTENTKVREKREEKHLKDGCFSHKTTVALLALASSIRFCAESIAAELKPNFLKPWP